MELPSIASATLSLNPTKSQIDRADDLRAAAEGFEEFFMHTFLKSARAGAIEDKLTGGSSVSSAQEMFDSEIAKVASSRTGFGIADAVVRQFSGQLAYRGMK